MKNNNASRSTSAFIDAVDGVAATIVTVWAFYPLDLWKTRLQADRNRSSCVEKRRDCEATNVITFKKLKSVQSLFKGVGAKSIHSVSSSFCYFYIYSWIVAQHRRRRKHGTPKAVSPAVGLVLSALAAAANTCITLPLDVLSTRRQTREEKVGNIKTARVSSGQEEDSRESMSMCARIRSAKSLWRGLLPSLILCTNPAINFTVFDFIKSMRLRQKKGDRLSMIEAFVLGLIAKFVATIITYPLIQAKVKIMSSDGISLLTCLKDNYQAGGVYELYRGCDLQLLHTVLKSALMMMIRERISHSTRLWLAPQKTP